MKDIDSKRWTRVPASTARTVGLCALVCAGLLVLFGTYVITSEDNWSSGALAFLLTALLALIGVAVDRKRYDDDPPKMDAQQKDDGKAKTKEEAKSKN